MRNNHFKFFTGLFTILSLAINIGTTVCAAEDNQKYATITDLYIPDNATVETTTATIGISTKSSVNNGLEKICKDLRSNILNDIHTVYVAKDAGIVVFGSDKQENIDKARDYCVENDINLDLVQFILIQPEESSIDANIHFNASDTESNVQGDVNTDGAFNVLDVVLFQKWILAIPDTHLDNWKAADFCKDDVLNVLDLILMKKTLLEENR